MAFGPVLIFDKSTLQSLNADEAVWLDNFYLTNITPLFFIETLADLEKAVRTGRTPEDVVGNLAYKTPDADSCLNARHTHLLEAELCGGEKIDMVNGRPVRPQGKRVMLGGRTGVIFEESPEDEAFRRWQRREFLEVERLLAKQWRQSLSNLDYGEIYQAYQKFFVGEQKPKTLAEVKTVGNHIIDGPDREMILRFGLSVVGAPEIVQKKALSRWDASGRPMLNEFAPYFRHVFSVDLFFYLAIAADLISRERPSNKIDLAYLYYLPFCMVFASSDKLHARVGPLFLTSMQTFVSGSALKEDLAMLDRHYSSLPEDVKNQGVIKFAPYPPADGSFLVSQLWDKYLPKWREVQTQSRKPMCEEANAALVAKIRNFAEKATPTDVNIDLDSAERMLVRRVVVRKKGKWDRFPVGMR